MEPAQQLPQADKCYLADTRPHIVEAVEQLGQDGVEYLLGDQLLIVLDHRPDAVDRLELSIPATVLNEQQGLLELAAGLGYFGQVLLVDVHDALLRHRLLDWRLVVGFDP